MWIVIIILLFLFALIWLAARPSVSPVTWSTTCAILSTAASNLTIAGINVNVTLIFSQVSRLQGRDVFKFSITAEMEMPQGG